MSPRKFHLHDGKKGVALAVRVTPRARHNEITEIQEDGTVRIRLTAAPSDNEANNQLVRFLAEVLGVPASHVEIVAGHTGRDKLVSVVDASADQVQERLLAYVN